MAMDLDKLSAQWNGEVTRVLYNHGITRHADKPRDLLRYLNWRVWCLRWGVTLDWLLDRMLNSKHQGLRSYFEQNRKKATRRKGTDVSLGLSSATLTGPAMERFLYEQLISEYPHGENVMLLRQGMRLAIEEAGPVPEGERTRRAWRGNPWR